MRELIAAVIVLLSFIGFACMLLACGLAPSAHQSVLAGLGAVGCFILGYRESRYI